MTKIQNIAFWVIAVIVIGLLLSQLAGSGNPTQNVSGVYNQVQSFFDQAGLRIGKGAHTVTYFDNTTCNLTQSVIGSFAASSTKEHWCAVSGVRAGDSVRILLPHPSDGSSNAYLAKGLGSGFDVITAFATTSDVIGIDITNNSGAATSSYAWATTSVKVHIERAGGTSNN